MIFNNGNNNGKPNSPGSAFLRALGQAFANGQNRPGARAPVARRLGVPPAGKKSCCSAKRGR